MDTPEGENGGHYANRPASLSWMPEKNGVVVPSNRVTNHCQFFWKTPVLGVDPNSVHMAFSLDFVVTDCQPPSWRSTKRSETLAMKFPCRKTNASPSSWIWTDVLPEVQLRLLRMAAFIWRSIFLIKSFGWILFYYTWKKHPVRGACDSFSTDCF